MQKKHQALWGYLFIGPQLLGLLCFSLLPLLYAFYLSFVNWDGFGVPLFVGLDNFRGQLSDPDFWKALHRRNLRFRFCSTISRGCIPLIGH